MNVFQTEKDPSDHSEQIFAELLVARNNPTGRCLATSVIRLYHPWRLWQAPFIYSTVARTNTSALSSISRPLLYDSVVWRTLGPASGTNLLSVPHVGTQPQNEIGLAAVSDVAIVKRARLVPPWRRLLPRCRRRKTQEDLLNSLYASKTKRRLDH